MFHFGCLYMCANDLDLARTTHPCMVLVVSIRYMLTFHPRGCILNAETGRKRDGRTVKREIRDGKVIKIHTEPSKDSTE